MDLSAKATKALFSLNSKITEYSTLNVETLLKLFDTLIQPILTYASEIWISDYKIDLMNDKYPFELYLTTLLTSPIEFSLYFQNYVRHLNQNFREMRNIYEIGLRSKIMRVNLLYKMP